jgi:hypothetical protein
MTYITDLAKGDPTNIQINTGGKLDGDNNLTWDSNTLTLGNGKNINVDGTDISNGGISTQGNLHSKSITLQETGGTTNTIKFQAPSDITSDYTLTFPLANTIVSGYVLSSTTTGVLSWIEAGTTPAGTIEGSIQFRNSTGDNLDANDENFTYNLGTKTLKISDDDTGVITGLKNPTTNFQAANKAYVDSIAGSGVSWKNSVVVMLASPQALTSLTDSDNVDGLIIDGHTFVNGDRILLAGQGGNLTTPHIENGIYRYVDAAGGASGSSFTNTEDTPIGGSASGAAVFVEKGVYDNQGWIVTTDDSNFGDAIVWSQFNAQTSVSGIVNSVQFTADTSTLSGSSDFTWDGTSLKLGDAKAFVSGAGEELTIVHSGSAGAGSITNTVGSLTIENTASSDVVLKLGEASGLTKVSIKDNADVEVFSVNSGGLLTTDRIIQNSSDFFIASESVGTITAGKGIVASGDYLYITGVTSNTIYIYNSHSNTDDPPTLVGSLTDINNLKNIEHVIYNGTTLFVGGYDTINDSFITSIDIKNPADPTVIYKKVNSSSDVLADMIQMGGKYILGTEVNGESTTNLEITNPALTHVVSIIGSMLTETYGVDIVGDKIYFSGIDSTNGALAVFEMITDVDNPHVINHIGTVFNDSNMKSPRKLKVQGNYAYIASFTSSTTNGIYVVDVSDINNMVKVGTTYSGSPINSLGVIYDMVISGKYLYVIGDASDDLQRIDISDPENLIGSGRLIGFNSPRGLSISGGYLYVTNYSGSTVTKVNIGSAKLPQISSGHIETTYLSTTKNALVQGQLNVGSGISLGGSFTSQGHISTSSSLVTKGSVLFYEPDGGNSRIKMTAPNIVTNHTITLPSALGSTGDILTDTGSGFLGWTTPYKNSRTVVASPTYTILPTDDMIGVTHTTTAEVTITLPEISSLTPDTFKFYIVDEGGNAGTFPITIVTSGSDTIKGLSSFVINLNYNSISLYHNSSTGWFIY